MTEFVAPDLKEFLEKNKSSTFEDLWERNDPWFEEPNIGRSKTGWSGVCRFTLDGKGFFLKKQENFYTYSIKSPLGKSVAEKEFNNLKLYNELKIPSMKVAYFGVRKVEDKLQAMILTEELSDYMSLAEAVELWETAGIELKKKRRVISRVASLVRDAHKKGAVHYSLYPKHIFLHEGFVKSGNEDSQPICRFIDLEKAVQIPWGKKKQLRDLDTLNRRSKFWSKTDRLYFLQCYLMRNSLNLEVRKIIKKINSISKK